MVSPLQSVRRRVFSSSSSSTIAIPARLRPASSRAATRRSRVMSAPLYIRVPPAVRPGVTRPARSYARRFCTPVPTISAATEMTYTLRVESLIVFATFSSQLVCIWLER